MELQGYCSSPPHYKLGSTICQQSHSACGCRNPLDKENDDDDDDIYNSDDNINKNNINNDNDSNNININNK